ncbi:unnamed protein product, partial [Leptidea sinapis]
HHILFIVAKQSSVATTFVSFIDQSNSKPEQVHCFTEQLKSEVIIRKTIQNGL